MKEVGAAGHRKRQDSEKRQWSRPSECPGEWPYNSRPSTPKILPMKVGHSTSGAQGIGGKQQDLIA